MKNIIYTLIGIVVFALSAQPVLAASPQVSDASAHPNFPVQNEDERVVRLKIYLETHNSPLADSAGHFVSEADRLGLDWKLVAAIAGVESTFGKHIPANSYNGWGWGVFTGMSDGIHFVSWNDGITKVSEGLRYRYVDKGAGSVEQIGRIYAASPVWSAKVQFFLQKIEKFEPNRVDHLAVTI
ncbi:MAG: hypothetical protein AAB960_01775 [Patescibacteria group bacterium]